MLHRIGKFLELTINFRESYSQPQWTVQILCENRVLLVRADLHVFLSRHQHPKGEWPIHLVYQTYFFKLRPSSNPTNRNLVQSARQNQTLFIIRHVFIRMFFWQWQRISPLKLFSLRSECPSMCLYVCVCTCVCVLCIYVNGWLH